MPGFKLNETHQHAKDANLLGGIIYTIKQEAETLSLAHQQNVEKITS
jgi:hypothetical protein